MRCVILVIKLLISIFKILVVNSKRMLEACEAFVTYESGIILERQGFEVNDEPVWILGREYDTKTKLDELNSDVKSRLLLTYRRNFPPIGDSGMTSDRGWGCMLRCGQMVVAQALINQHLGREPFWPVGDDQRTTESYKKILKLFEDKKTAVYSIHQLAQMGVSEGKEIGQWFGPNTVAQVLKKLCEYDEWSALKIHVAMDNAVVIEEIEQLCHKKITPTETSTWSPLLLVVPLRLGLLNINPIYIDSLKACLQMPQSIGMIGGKPSQALYFIGYVGDDVVFLDPHLTQNAIDLDEDEFDDSSYHPATCARISFQSMDPSLAVCFSCTTHSEWKDLLRQFKDMTEIGKKQNLFEVCSQRQAEWHPSTTDLVDEAIALDSADSEDEFEILG
ncbi:cysteine protease ATG4B-like [Daphnia pulicaria]|uniref:cysteine protease ATG4B-like n=1 Tax=Daphnia pulicaria TaxID=35523 RepID=UPI001EEC8BEE|nr:cysteine protease ATG4B-like [Daphnia pulicaria]